MAQYSAKNLTIFGSYFGRKDDFINSFLNLLTFSTMVNGTLLNFSNIYEDDLRVIFDQWPKLHLGVDALSNQKKS